MGENQEPPERPVSVTADSDKTTVHFWAPPGGSHRAGPHARSVRAKQEATGWGGGRTTPDTLKVKTSHVMLQEGTGFLSAPAKPPF